MFLGLLRGQIVVFPFPGALAPLSDLDVKYSLWSVMHAEVSPNLGLFGFGFCQPWPLTQESGLALRNEIKKKKKGNSHSFIQQSNNRSCFGMLSHLLSTKAPAKRLRADGKSTFFSLNIC